MDLFVFSANNALFGHCGSFKSLCLGLDRLIGPTLVHGSGHGKGRSKLSWLGFRHGA